MKYKSRGLRKRGDNSWQARISHLDPITGEQVTTYHTIRATSERQAKEKRDELLYKLESGGLAMGDSTTIQQFMESFLEYKVSSKTIEPSTIRGYKGDSKMMCKYIGADRLCDLNVAMVNRWMAKMSEDGYSPKSISKCFRLLKQALNYAIAQELLTKNPCNFCKPPKRVKTPINSLSREDRSRMLELARRAQPSALAVAIEIMLTTGVRRGEVCALRWSDFDESKKTITVSHSLGNGEGGFYLKQPKTEEMRTIPLTLHAHEMLQQMREDLKWMCSKLKVKLDDAFILGTLESESRPYNPTQLGKDFAAFCKMNGFDCTLHDLRHTFATFMIGSGADVRTVADYLGHSNPSMTLDIYADVDPEAKQQAVKYIEDAFDDSYSVFQRRVEQRRAEMKEPYTGFDPKRIENITPESIPFSIEELRTMLSVLEKAI